MHSKKRTLELFKILGARYGHIWKSQFKDREAMRRALIEWHRELEKITDLQLSYALNKCNDPKNNVFMPPSLPKFLSFCYVDFKELGYNSKEGDFNTKDDVWMSISSWDRQHKADFELKKIYQMLHIKKVETEIKEINKNIDYFLEKKLKNNILLKLG